MAWTVALLIVAVVAVGPLAAKEIAERPSYNNVDDLPINTNELLESDIPGVPLNLTDFTNSQAMEDIPDPIEYAGRFEGDIIINSPTMSKVNEPTNNTCADVGGKCIPRKAAQKKCKGKIDETFDCANGKKVCCIDGCPEGTFWFPPSNQCFKLLTDSKRNWNDGQEECSKEGLVLARPYFPVALRSYLVTRYGSDVEAWINGRGNGTYVVWQNNGQVITSANPLWWPGAPWDRVTSSWCLLLRARENFWSDHLDNPYYSTICSRGLLTLCEWELN